MASIDFVYNASPGKLEEFITKLKSVGLPDKITTEYPKTIGFGSSHARGFPAVLKYAGLLDSSGKPNDAYTKGLRGGEPGRSLVADAIKKSYKPMFDTYPKANTQSDADLRTFVKSNSNLDDEKAGLVVRTFKVLCKFADFDGSGAIQEQEEDGNEDGGDGAKGNPRRRRNTGGSGAGVVINVNIGLSVDATSDPAVYDAFFAAMATHLKGLIGDAADA